MKGKGKKGKEIDEEPSSPVHEFKKIDLTKECPKYLEILDRNIEEGIKLEELDALQLEIEALLVSVVYRKRQIEDEMEFCLNLQDKQKDKNKDSNFKKNKIDERPSKRFKENPDFANTSTSSSSSSSSNSSLSSSSSSSSTSSSPKSSLKAKKKNLKSNKYDETKFGNYLTCQNDIPNRFWNFISTFCSPIKPEYLKMLEDMVSVYENESEYLKIVRKNNFSNSNGKISLSSNEKTEQNGTIKEIKKENSKIKKSENKKKGLSSLNTSETKPKINKDSKNDLDKCDYGVLTQRLVSCLIEEDFCAENFEDIFEEFSDTKTNLSNNDTKLFKTINLNNAAQFEKLLRKELEEHGLIDSEDLFVNDTSENEEDEINQEIIKCQNELRSIMTQNQFQIKKLINIIKTDIKKQQILNNLDQVNEEILEISKRLIAVKQKRKNSKEAKKEKEIAQKYLKDRISVLQQLNESQI